MTKLRMMSLITMATGRCLLHIYIYYKNCFWTDWKNPLHVHVVEPYLWRKESNYSRISSGTDLFPVSRKYRSTATKISFTSESVNKVKTYSCVVMVHHDVYLCRKIMLVTHHDLNHAIHITQNCTMVDPRQSWCHRFFYPLCRYPHIFLLVLMAK